MAVGDTHYRVMHLSLLTNKFAFSFSFTVGFDVLVVKNMFDS